MSTSIRGADSIIRLRGWQTEALKLHASGDQPSFLAVATPGAGKTTFALLAAAKYRLLNPASHNTIIVAPTSHIRHQWAADATRFGLRLIEDWKPGDDLPSDAHGLVTTFAQLSMNPSAFGTVSRDGFVIIDEIHHAGESRSWGDAVRVAFEGAGKRLLLSGTPFRSDNHAIPFVNYSPSGYGLPDYDYGFESALQDQVIRSVKFVTVGGRIKWKDATGADYEADFGDDLPSELVRQRLRAALHPTAGWMRPFLTHANDTLQTVRRTTPDAAGLVLCMDQAHAKETATILHELTGVKPVTVVSEDTKASKKIRAFTDSTAPWIVAVRLISEGVSIPRAAVLAWCSTTSTELFFRQAVGRVVRTRPAETVQAHVFLPDDPRLRSYASRIATPVIHQRIDKADIDPSEEPSTEFDSEDSFVNEGPDTQMTLFEPLGGHATAPTITKTFDLHPVLSYDQTNQILEQVDLSTFRSAFNPTPPTSAGLASQPVTGETHETVRITASSRAQQLATLTGLTPREVNSKLNRHCGIVSVRTASIPELRKRISTTDHWMSTPSAIPIN